MHIAQDLLPWIKTTPQPVALATGRVVRAIGSAEKLDACIKAAEVVARFVAFASLASSAATRPDDVSPPEVQNFVGNLSFGVFENAARVSASVGWYHPLRRELRQCFKRRGIAGHRLDELVKLRNELGHAITPADEARARALLERDDPIGALIELLEDLKTVLEYPLLALLVQEHRRGRVIGHFAFFSGEGEPIPQELELRDPLYEWESPYLCTPEGLIPLPPGILYKPRSSDGRLGLYFLDGVADEALRYKNIQDNGTITRTEGFCALSRWMQLPFAPKDMPFPQPLLEKIACMDGRSMHSYLSGRTAEPHAPETASEVHPVGRRTTASPEIRALGSLRDFERVANSMALGSSYRDILYCFVEHGTRVELSDGTVRIISASDPTRVIATIEVAHPGTLRLTMFVSVLTSDTSQETELYELIAGESADGVVDRIGSLIQTRGPTESASL